MIPNRYYFTIFSKVSQEEPNFAVFGCNSSAFGFLLQATPTFKVAYSEVGVALVLFTLSSMPNQQSDWAWGELLHLAANPLFFG